MVPRADKVCWQLGQSKQLLQRYFLCLASDDGMFSRQLKQKWESTSWQRQNPHLKSDVGNSIFLTFGDSRRFSSPEVETMPAEVEVREGTHDSTGTRVINAAGLLQGMKIGTSHCESTERESVLILN